MKHKSLIRCRRRGLFGILAALALSLIQVNSSSAELIGLWRADGDAKDASGRGNDGTLVNDVTYVTDGDRQAFSFDGRKDKILLEGNPLSGLSQFTYVAWVKPVEGQNNLFSRSAGDFSDIQNNYFSFFISNEGQLAWGLGGNAADITFSERALIVFDQWQHIALTRDGLTIKIYINGEEMVNSLDKASANAVMEDPLQFGDWQFSGYSFSGLIDEIGLFDETLSQSDIQAIMTSGVGGGATAVEAMSWGRVKADER